MHHAVDRPLPQPALIEVVHEQPERTRNQTLRATVVGVVTVRQRDRGERRPVVWSCTNSGSTASLHFSGGKPDILELEFKNAGMVQLVVAFASQLIGLGSKLATWCAAIQPAPGIGL
jgi:hypothetical protein